ncbi:MAG: amino acid adenylation domain-containing protein, partial [Candidatus Aminicenantes bacterium]
LIVNEKPFESPRLNNYQLTIDNSQLNSTSLAYIIYTSGTTGKPKGVLVEHKNVVRLLFNDEFQFDFNSRDVWTLFHSFCFDFSVWEMYGALLYGGQLIVIPRMVARDPQAFLKRLQDHQVTVLNQTPTAFYNLVHEEVKQTGNHLTLRYVIFGGEALQPGKLKEWKEKYPHTRLVNMFGITETTVHVTYQEIGKEEIEKGISNIGKPIPTLRTYIWDRHQRLVPIGTPGELCVGGEGVARGYLNRPGLTAGRFVENSYQPGERLYKSGDLSRLSYTGDMEYLGRIDHQVQIRGFRVELGEIENQLLKHEQIRAAVVIDRTAGENDHYLCAYIVPTSPASTASPDIPSLKEYLSARLPDYMVPGYFVRLEEIPLTPHGKVDRKKLPGPHVSPDSNYTAPGNKQEQLMAQVWQEVLELEQVGIHDNFFDVGGDSIKTLRLISAINNRFNSHLKILDLYTHGTIGQLAALVNREESFDRRHIHQTVLAEIKALKNRILVQSQELADTVEDIYPMSDIEKGMVFYYLKHPGTGVYHDQFVYPIYYKDFNPERFRQVLNLMIEKHGILRTAFNLEDFGESVHIVYKNLPVPFAYHDLSHLSASHQHQRLQAFLVQDRANPFDARVAPLWRMVLFALGNDNFYLLFIVHHAILDGWSTASFMTELHNTYIELSLHPCYVPQKLKADYKDTVIQELVEKQNSSILDYWKKELEDYRRLDFSETQKGKNELELMKTYRYNAGPALTEQLRHIAAQYHTNVKNLCFSAYACFMNMFSYEDDILVGCVTNNRPEHEDGDKVLGCFLNTVPVRLKIPRGITWQDYLPLVEEKMLEIKKHERLSLFEIAVTIGEKSKDRNPFFDTLFNFMDFHIFQQATPSKQTKTSRPTPDQNELPPLENQQDTNTLFDFEVDITTGDFMLYPKYNRAAVSDLTVEKCCGYFLNILDKYINDPHGLLSNENILSREEKETVLYRFNDTQAPYCREKTMHQLFEEQVEKTPGELAVIGIDGKQQLSYRQLNNRANQLAGLLRKKGVTPGYLAAVIIDRSIEMVFAVMGILKAGGAYVPLETYLPDERIRKITAALHIQSVITNARQLPKLVKIAHCLPLLNHIICLDRGAQPGVEPKPGEKNLPGKTPIITFEEIESPEVENLAASATSGDISYVIFTSGST